jgi:hypothetical protein
MTIKEVGMATFDNVFGAKPLEKPAFNIAWSLILYLVSINILILFGRLGAFWLISNFSLYEHIDAVFLKSIIDSYTFCFAILLALFFQSASYEIPYPFGIYSTMSNIQKKAYANIRKSNSSSTAHSGFIWVTVLIFLVFIFPVLLALILLPDANILGTLSEHDFFAQRFNFCIEKLTDAWFIFSSQFLFIVLYFIVLYFLYGTGLFHVWLKVIQGKFWQC